MLIPAAGLAPVTSQTTAHQPPPPHSFLFFFNNINNIINENTSLVSAYNHRHSMNQIVVSPLTMAPSNCTKWEIDQGAHILSPKQSVTHIMKYHVEQLRFHFCNSPSSLRHHTLLFPDFLLLHSHD